MSLFRRAVIRDGLPLYAVFKIVKLKKTRVVPSFTTRRRTFLCLPFKIGCVFGLPGNGLQYVTFAILSSPHCHRVALLVPEGAYKGCPSYLEK